MGKLLGRGGTWVCAEFSGIITKEDYQAGVVIPAARAIEKHGYFNLLISYQDHRGWEPDAAELSMNTICAMGGYTGRVAYINPPPKKIFQMKILKPIVSGQVRFYDSGGANEALTWVRNE